MLECSIIQCSMMYSMIVKAGGGYLPYNMLCISFPLSNYENVLDYARH
jgi:hypothetical protein